MAFALVGVAGAAVQGAVSGSVTPLFGQTPTAGNLLLLFLSYTGAAGSPLSPGNGWTGGANAIGGTSAQSKVMWKIATGSDTTSAIPAFTGAIISAHIEEWSGGPATSPLDQVGVAVGTTSPITATLAAANVAANELVAMAGSDFRSAARASNDTWTSNHGTPTLRRSNNGVSSQHHYSHATLISNSAAAADTTIMTLSITTSITGLAVAAASFKLADSTPVTGTFNRDNRLVQQLAH